MGGHKIKGKVCSEAMALASPVWEKFVYPPWGNPVPQQRTVAGAQYLVADKTTTGDNRSNNHPVSDLDFSEDDTQALLFLLRVAHLEFAPLPDDLTGFQVYQIAILVDQY